MARRRPDPVLQKLRRLARAGKRREAVEMLEQAIQNNPNHMKAREELSRHLTGKPFSFEEADYNEVLSIISAFLSKPQCLSAMRKAALKKLHHRSIYLERALEHIVTVADKKALHQLRNAISRDLQRRRKPLSKIGIVAAACLVLLVCAGGTGFFLWKSAGHAADALADFSKTVFDSHAARNLLKIHDTGLNRTLNRRVGEEAARVRALIHATEQRAREVDAILKSIEAGKQTVVGQGVRRRALVERRLRELGRDGLKLQARWAILCKREQKELNQQRLSLAEELMSPLPERQGVTGNPDEDLAQLTTRIKMLRQRINIYDDAGEALKLPEDIIIPARRELQADTAIVNEITALQNLLEILPSAHDYEHYRRLLSEYKPELYLPAVELMDIRHQLPTEASVRGMMQEHGQKLPPGLLQAARESLMDGGPTFSSRFPANKEQLHLLNELLTNSALSTRLYELTNVIDKLEAYSEALPELRYGRACFNRSALDPQRDVRENKAVEWQNPNAVVSRVLDPRPLYKELGLDNKTGFVTTANLPQLITRLLRHHHPDVPPLAKAYVFYYLLKANNSATHDILSGFRYAPEMRAVAESFEQVRRECGIKLDGDCWLRRSQAHATAELKFARWFNKHRKIDFTGELRKNLGKLLSVSARFAGYINEHGHAVLFAEVGGNKLIWYLSQDAMTASELGEPLQEPMPLSPVFIMDK